jgi:hypothetical protein
MYEYRVRTGLFRGENNPCCKIGRIEITKDIKEWIDGGSADVVFDRHTSALGHINLNSLGVHRE